MLSEISQRKTNTVWNHLHVESKRYNKLVNITKKKWWMVKVAQSCPTLCDPMDCSLLGSSSVGFSRQEIHIYREQTSGYLWGEGSGKGQYGGRGLRSTNYYTVYIISQKKKKISLQFSHSVMSYSLRPHGLQHIRLPCPSPTPGAYPNSCPSSQWCHPTISSSVIPLSSCLQSFPASGSFQMSQFFTSGGQSIGVSASVLPMNIQDWIPLG